MKISQQQIENLCWDIRDFLEPYWLETHRSWDEQIPNPISRWMCRYSSIFLAEVFSESFGEGWKIVAGRPQIHLNGTSEGVFGMLAKDGTWNDHCWISGHELIIDITADQFGYSPVIITSIDDFRYKANLAQKDLELSLRKLRRKSQSWLRVWKMPLNNEL